MEWMKTQSNNSKKTDSEEEEELSPLQPTQNPTLSTNSKPTHGSEQSSSRLQPMPFQNDHQWEQFLNLEIERIFQD